MVSDAAPPRPRKRNPLKTAVGQPSMCREMAGQVPHLSRRKLLQAGCAAAASLTLAACGRSAAAPSLPHFSSAAASAKPAASSSDRRLSIATTTIAGSQWPIWLAESLHAWQDRGLAVERKMIAGGVATKALVAREMDVLMQAAAPIITAGPRRLSAAGAPGSAGTAACRWPPRRLPPARRTAPPRCRPSRCQSAPPR